MNLSTDVLDAIRNKTYQLRPVKTQKKRRQSSPPVDFNIAQILARRIAMGYGGMEEDNQSIKSISSIKSFESVKSISSIKSIKSNKSVLSNVFLF